MGFLLLSEGIQTLLRETHFVGISSGVLSCERQPARGVSTDSMCWLLDEPSLHSVKETRMLGQILSPVLNSTLQPLFCFLHDHKPKQRSQLISFPFFSSALMGSASDHPEVYHPHIHLYSRITLPKYGKNKQKKGTCIFN